MADQPKDFFQDFRERMKKWSESEGKSNQWADFLMSAPDLLLLLCKLSIDKGVPEKEKAKLVMDLQKETDKIDDTVIKSLIDKMLAKKDNEVALNELLDILIEIVSQKYPSFSLETRDRSESSEKKEDASDK